MTLSQWAKDNDQVVQYDNLGCLFVCINSHDKGYDELWRLEDFKVSSVIGPVIRLIGDHRTKKVGTREAFLTLSYYTLCRLSDTLNTASIEGMVNLIANGTIEGLLTTDTLGNFLVIE